MASLSRASDGAATATQRRADTQETESTQSHPEISVREHDANANVHGKVDAGDLRQNYRTYIRHALRSAVEGGKSDFAYSDVVALDGVKALPGVCLEGFGRLGLPLCEEEEGTCRDLALYACRHVCLCVWNEEGTCRCLALQICMYVYMCGFLYL
jgi:hypothetical protein